VDLATRTQVVRQDRVRAEEHVVLRLDPVPYRHTVLDGHAVAQDRALLGEAVLADVALGTDLGPAHHGGPCPDARARADRVALDEGEGVLVEGRGQDPTPPRSREGRHPGRLPQVCHAPSDRAPVPGVRIIRPAPGPQLLLGARDVATEDQYALPRSAGIVLRTILTSCSSDHVSMYSTSRRTISSNESLFRPLTCQRPVMPGRTSSRLLC